MTSIDPLSLQRIITDHGTPEGAAYFDAEESIVHDVFPDRIAFQTNFMDNRSYEVSVVGGEVCVRMTRLDNYRRGHKARLIDDDMDEDDWEELAILWQRLSQDLDPQLKIPPLDIADALADLFGCLFDEDRAQTLIENIPADVAQQWDSAWTHVASVLTAAGLLAHFEWKAWAGIGIGAVNALAPLQQAGIEIPVPDASTVDAVNRADDWARALLQYFNAYLDAHDLKLLALGTHFDEYQAFACLPMNGLGLANALEVMGRLGIVHKY